MNRKIFFDLNGKYLYLDHYLVDFDIPIFYICKDDWNNKYAVSCIDSHKDEYIISKTNNSNIKAMLENQLSLRKFMLDSDEKWHTFYDINQDCDVVTNILDIKEEQLPKKDEYLDLYNKRVMDYLKILDEEIKADDIEFQMQEFFKKCQFYESQVVDLNYYNLISENEFSVKSTNYLFKYITDFLQVFIKTIQKIKKQSAGNPDSFDEISYGKISFEY